MPTTTKALIHRALEAQAFRQVALNELVAAPFHLPGVSAEVDAALTRAGQNPNWTEVVRQLAQLRTNAFWGLHLRLDTADLEIVAMYAWRGNPGHLVAEYMDFVQTIMTNLAKDLGEFTLSSSDVRALESVKAIAAASPLAKTMASFLIDMNKATMPNTNVIFLDSVGGSADFAALFTNQVSRVSVNPFNFNRPWTFGLGIDGSTLRVHGSNDVFTLNVEELNRTLPFLRANG